MRILRRLALLSAALLCWSLAVAQSMVTEVITLHYRTVDEVATILKPLVPPPGAVTGLQSQLVVRTTPENLQAVREVLEKVDQAPRRLMISVKQERNADTNGLRTDLSGRITAGDLTVSSGRPEARGTGLVVNATSEAGSRGSMRVLSTRSANNEVGVQRIQALEGRPAFIRAGRSVPVAERSLISSGTGTTVQDTVSYKDVTSGFYVLPRVSGNRVTLEIAPHSAHLSRGGGGKIDFQEARTVISGRLGEWLEVGGTLGESTDSGSGTAYSTRRRGDSSTVILLKVEELR